MADNLIAGLLGAPRPFTATEVGNFLAQSIRPLTSVNVSGGKDYVLNMINKLTAMQEASAISEQKAYNQLGANSLEELQAELDRLNASGLMFLSNAAIRKMPLMKNIQKPSVPIAEVRSTIE